MISATKEKVTLLSFKHPKNGVPDWALDNRANLSGNDLGTQQGFNTNLKMRFNDRGLSKYADMKGVRVGWFAYDPEECPNIQSGYLEEAKPKLKGQLKFTRKFAKTPKVFTAIRFMEMSSRFNLRLAGKATDVTNEKFEYDCGTWAAEGDYNVTSQAWVWIAMV